MVTGLNLSSFKKSYALGCQAFFNFVVIYLSKN
jgi:hypothetical protein